MPPPKLEDDPSAPSSHSPSFKGRLNLQDFVFGSQAQPPLGSSRRPGAPLVEKSGHASTTPGSASPAPPTVVNRPKTRTSKRKQAAEGLLPSPPGKKRTNAAPPPSRYAPPSTYAHLTPLTDALHPDMLILFVGLNPGVETARTGHAYAHPTNLFWRLLRTSNVTTRLCRAGEYASLPGLGFTNIVARPSRNGAELARRELDAGVEVLEDKVRRWRPQVACIVGKSIWESIWRVRRGRGIRKDEFRYGWQDEGERMGCPRAQQDGSFDHVADGVLATSDWKGAKVFVATSTSGLAATPPLKEKERIWKELGAWVEQERMASSLSTQSAGN